MASVKDLKAEIESLKTEVGEHITENKSLTECIEKLDIKIVK